MSSPDPTPSRPCGRRAWALQKCSAPLCTAVARVGEERFLGAYRPHIRYCLAAGDVTLSSACRIASASARIMLSGRDPEVLT